MTIRRYLRVSFILASVASLVFICPTAMADQLVEFTNGHVMRVQQYEVDGDHLRLILGDDSEIVVFRSKVLNIEEAEITREQLESGQAATSSGRNQQSSSGRSTGSGRTGGASRGSSTSGSSNYQRSDTGRSASSGRREVPPDPPTGSSSGSSGRGSGAGGRNIWDRGGDSGGSSGANGENTGKKQSSGGGAAGGRSTGGGSRGQEMNPAGRK